MHETLDVDVVPENEQGTLELREAESDEDDSDENESGESMAMPANRCLRSGYNEPVRMQARRQAVSRGMASASPVLIGNHTVRFRINRPI